VNRLVDATEGRVIAIDGMTLRRSHDRAAGQGPLHLISAWATEDHLTLGQMAVDGKSNEITAIPEPLKILDVTGAIVTIDALGCQKSIAAPIRAGGGDTATGVSISVLHSAKQVLTIKLRSSGMSSVASSDGTNCPRRMSIQWLRRKNSFRMST
jgi:hypothetical protein